MKPLAPQRASEFKSKSPEVRIDFFQIELSDGGVIADGGDEGKEGEEGWEGEEGGEGEEGEKGEVAEEAEEGEEGEEGQKGEEVSLHRRRAEVQLAHGAEERANRPDPNAAHLRLESLRIRASNG